MKTKYFYTQDAERPSIKYLDRYKDGETKTIAGYDTETGYKEMIYRVNADIKAIYDFFNYCAEGRPIKVPFEYYKLWQE